MDGEVLILKYFCKYYIQKLFKYIFIISLILLPVRSIISLNKPSKLTILVLEKNSFYDKNERNM